MYLILAYLIVGSFTTSAAYLATGVAQFGVDVFDEEDLTGVPQLGSTLENLIGRKLALVPDIAVGFVFSRFLIGLLEAVALTWCKKRAYPDYLLLVVGTAVPALSEVLGAYPFAHNWVGMSLAVIVTWPNVPEYIMPAGLVFRTAAAYLAPPLLTGLILSTGVVLERRWTLRRVGASGS